MFSSVLSYSCPISDVSVCSSIYKYHAALHRLDSLHRPYLDQCRGWPTYRLVHLCVEWLICCVHDPPSLNVLFDVSIPSEQSLYFLSRAVVAHVANPWVFCVFVRFYLLNRLVLVESYKTGPVVLCRWVKFDLTDFFMTRQIIVASPFTTVSVLSAFVLIATAFSLLVCDKSVGADRNSFPGSLWVAFATVTTLGYGDLYVMLLQSVDGPKKHLRDTVVSLNVI